MGELKKVSTMADLLREEDGLVTMNLGLYIPKSIPEEILARLHTGHQGIGRVYSRSHDSVWWPSHYEEGVRYGKGALQVH